MSKLKINFIGAGKLGNTLARLIVLNNAGVIDGVCNSDLESSERSVAYIGQGTAYSSIAKMPLADIIFITVPDDKIKIISEELLRLLEFSDFDGILVHCSGLLSSDIFGNYCPSVSVHPLRSFANPELSVNEFNGTYCAIEGHAESVLILSEIFKQIGAKLIPLNKDKKAIYHAASVMATNYMVALADTAIKSMDEAGMSEDDSKQIILNMMQGTLNNLQNSATTGLALTGPIKRGDVKTIQAHISALGDTLTKKIYTVMGEATLSLTNHEDQIRSNILDELLLKGH